MATAIYTVIFLASCSLYCYCVYRLIVVESALRNLLNAFEDADNLERLHIAIQAARKVLS